MENPIRLLSSYDHVMRIPCLEVPRLRNFTRLSGRSSPRKMPWMKTARPSHAESNPRRSNKDLLLSRSAFVLARCARGLHVGRAVEIQVR